MDFQQLCFVALMGFSGHVFAAADYPLLLVGGDLPRCSTSEPAGCQNPKQQLQASAEVKPYQLNANIEPQLADLALAPSQKPAVLLVLQALIKQKPGAALSRREFERAFSKIQLSGDGQALDTRKLWQQLTKSQKAAIFSIFEQPTAHQQGYQANPLQLADRQTLLIYQAMLEQARTLRPNKQVNVVVVTAGEAEPYANARYYLSLFRQLGAAPVWLPLTQYSHATEPRTVKECLSLEPAMVQAEQLWHRATYYPELFVQHQQRCEQGDAFSQQLLQAADLILLTGDETSGVDAWFTADAKPSALLQTLQQRFLAKQLVLAAEGKMAERLTASWPEVQGETIDTDLGCGALCEEAKGVRHRQGLALLTLPPVIVRAGSQGRIPQLWQAKQAQAAPFAMGLDENTALLVKPDSGPLKLKVIGGQGVWLLAAEDSSNRAAAWRLHYLTHGDIAEQRQQKSPELTVQVASWKYAPPPKSAMLVQTSDVFRGTRLRSLVNLTCHNQAASASGLFELANQPWRLLIEKRPDTLFRAGVFQQQGAVTSACTAVNMFVSYQVAHE